MKILINILLSISLLTACSTQYEAKTEPSPVSIPVTTKLNSDAAVRPTKNPTLPEQDFLVVSIGEPHFEISKADGYNNFLLINVISSKKVPDPLILEVNGTKVSIPLELNEALPQASLSEALPQASLSEAVFLSYQEVDWSSIEEKLNDFERRISTDDYSWDSDFQPILDIRERYAKDWTELNQNWNGSIYHYLGWLNLDFSALKQNDLTHLSFKLGGKSFDFDNVDIKYQEQPMTNKPFSEIFASPTIVQRERPFFIDLQGNVMDPVIEEDLFAQEEVTFTGLNFFPETVRSTEIKGDLMSQAGKLIWSRKWKEGDEWNIPEGSTLKLRFRLQIPYLSKSILPQTNITVFYDYYAENEKFSSSLMINFISRKASKDLLLIEQDNLHTNQIQMDLARIDLVEMKLATHRLSNPK